MVSSFTTHGCWQSRDSTPAFGADGIVAVVQQVRESVFLVQDPRARAIGIAVGGETVPQGQTNGLPHWPLLAMLPPLFPEWLGCRSFGEVHGTRFPYVSGAMANGIATTQLVIAMAKAGFLGFFGAAGCRDNASRLRSSSSSPRSAIAIPGAAT